METFFSVRSLSRRLACPLLLIAAAATLRAADPVVLADFESDTGGFSDAIVRDSSVAQSGKASGKVQADLANVTSSAWVTVSKKLKFPNPIESLSFWVKSAEAKQVTVRIVDASGQTHQIRPPIEPNGEWQQVVINSFEAGPGRQSFGGANDQKVHWPAKSVAIIVEKNGLTGGSGTLWFDQIEAVLDPRRIVGKLDVASERLGNVFTTAEKVRVAVDTQGDAVKWVAKDFWGARVGEGDASVTGQRAVAEVAVATPGYYEVLFTAFQGGAALAEASAPFVVVEPFDLAAVKDSPFGVMTHFAQSWEQDVMPLIAHAGIKHIRDEMYWAHLEKTKGQFVFPEKFEQYMAAAKANALDPLVALTFGNPNYDHTSNAPGYGNAPFTDEGRAAYARYGVEVLKHFGPEIRAVEIWNEYNGTFGRGPAAKDKPKFYFEMLETSYKAIKAARPDVTVVGISAVATPFPYFEDLFQRGALKYMDALSLHPYRTQSTPEGLERLMTRLQTLIKKYSGGKPMPVWITELGWYVKGEDDRSDVIVTEADQAKYLVRAITLCLSAGVEKFYWYHLRDDQSFPNSGLVRGPDSPRGRYAPKPSYAAYAALTRELNGAKFEQREPTHNDETYSLRFRAPGGEVRVMWALAPAALAVKAAAPLRVVDLMGGEKTLAPQNGEVRLELSDTPVYVWGAISELPPVQQSAGKVVADSEEQFSSRQGDDGWSYGFFVAPAPGGPYAADAWQPLPEYRTTIWGYEWIGAQKYLTLTPSGSHPASDGGKPVWVVRRWTSTVDGQVRIKGRFARPEKGDGTTARIFVDGREVWKQQVGGGQPATTKPDVTVPVKTGSVVDFAVDPGPAADTSYDATSSAFTIIHLP